MSECSVLIFHRICAYITWTPVGYYYYLGVRYTVGHVDVNTNPLMGIQEEHPDDFGPHPAV